jgi:Tol biopolymer transport system component
MKTVLCRWLVIFLGLAVIFPSSSLTNAKAIPIYSSPNIIHFDQNHLSPNGELLAIGEWKKDEKQKLLLSVKIVDLQNGRVVSSLSNKVNGNAANLVELGTLSWADNSKSVFFTATGSNHVYRWDIQTSVPVIVTTLHRRITNLSVLHDGQKLLYIQEIESDSYKLGLFDFDKQKTGEIAQHVDPVTPIWLDDHRFLYVSRNKVYKYNTKNSVNVELASFREGKIKSLLSLSQGQIAILLYIGMDISDDEKEITFSTTKEVWQYTFRTAQLQKVLSTHTGSSGVAITSQNVIFSLSKDYQKSQLVVFDITKKDIRQLTHAGDKNDLPIVVNASKRVYFRRDDRVVMAVSY